MAADTRIDEITPANPAMAEVSMKRIILTRLIGTPRFRAAPGLPPVAWIQLPKRDAGENVSGRSNAIRMNQIRLM